MTLSSFSISDRLNHSQRHRNDDMSPYEVVLGRKRVSKIAESLPQYTAEGVVGSMGVLEGEELSNVEEMAVVDGEDMIVEMPVH